MIIAIDGPAGAGKSTIAKEVAKRLQWTYIDTGAMYRVVALDAINKEIDLADINNIIKAVDNIQIKIAHIDRNQHIFLNNKDVSQEIRSNEISQAASTVATIPEVRNKLVQLQRHLAKEQNVVMDGRDIGTIVLPNAEIKIFLTASLEERAKRRFKDQKEDSSKLSLDQIMKQINFRDTTDANRVASPLIQAKDSILIDTSGLTIDMVIEEILKLVKERLYVN
ncbi:MAG: cytidylate kinase [Candidatus Epulonipiscioides saccharophilum]|nr:MAG: cytidylate kinase [Epulopiscium sp. AS2M-Bin001]